MSFVKLPGEVDQKLQTAIENLNWKRVKHASYRKCKSMHLGLGTLRNCNKKVYYGEASHKQPELQKLLTQFIRDTAPHICYSSIIVNRYAVGESMDEHIDRNWTRHSMQLVGRFGTSQGGGLQIDGQILQNGMFLVDGNVKHRVLECTAGTMYSFVTYIKEGTLSKTMPRTCRKPFRPESPIVAVD